MRASAAASALAALCVVVVADSVPAVWAVTPVEANAVAIVSDNINLRMFILLSIRFTAATCCLYLLDE